MRVSFRLTVGAALLGTAYLSLAAAAMAWNEPLWVRQFGTADGDYATGVATDAKGNVYLSGYTGSSNPGSASDAWVEKYDAAGNALWMRQFATTDGDYATGVATDVLGSVYLTGNTKAWVWSCAPICWWTLNYAYAWVVRYDADGQLLWERQLGTDEGNATGVATDANGNVYVTGNTFGSLGGDAWVAKYVATGQALWVRQLGSDSDDISTGVATDANGNVYLTGYTYGSLGGPNRGEADVWMVKYDAAGHVVWKRQLGTDDADFGNGVATDPRGNVYLIGGTFGSLGGANRGMSDAWIAKYDVAGHVVWKRQLGTDETDFGNGVATDPKGNVYLTGGTSGSLGGTNRGGGDAWVVKYNTAGQPLWKRQLGTMNSDSATGVATDALGSVYLTGSTDGEIGGAWFGGPPDAWVAKYSTQR